MRERFRGFAEGGVRQLLKSLQSPGRFTQSRSSSSQRYSWTNDSRGGRKALDEKLITKDEMEEMDQFAMKEAEKDGTTTSQRTGHVVNCRFARSYIP
jgi:hypothetical protein